MPTLSWSNVTAAKGAWGVLEPDGTSTPIRDASGAPVTGFGAGWQPRGVLRLGDVAALLDLSHGDGGSTAWLLDGTAQVIAPRIRKLEAEATARVAQVLASAGAMLQPVMAALLERPSSAARRPEVDALLRLSRPVLPELFRQMEPGLPPPLIRAPRDKSGAPQPFAARASSGLRVDIPTARIDAWLGMDWMAILDAAVREQRLSLPALGHEGSIAEASYIPIDTWHGLICCHEPETGLGYAVAMRRHWGITWPVGVFFPRDWTYLLLRVRETYRRAGEKAEERDPLPFLLPGAVQLLLGGHGLLRWTADTEKRPAIWMVDSRWAHIGHYIWNEMLGLERVVAAAPESGPPDLYALAAAEGVEPYGPTEELYPEFQGRVQRAAGTLPDMLRSAVERRVHPLPLAGAFVTRKARQRIAEALAADPDLRPLADLADARLGAPGTGRAPMLAFGLRLQDRTLPDLPGFYIDLAEALLAEHGRLTIVFDGLNRKPGEALGSTFRTFTVKTPGTSLVARELAAVERFREAFAGRPVQIIDCVGSTMRANLFWLARCDIFVAPFGAGLVKTRWVLNKPGFVLASRVNLLHCTDISIYSSPAEMEDPAPMLLTEPNEVTDLPDLTAGPVPLRQRSSPWRENFDLDRGKVIPRIGAFLRECLAAGSKAQ